MLTANLLPGVARHWRLRFLGTCSTILFPLTAGCLQDAPRYELSQDKNGRTVRLDKETGDVAVIDGDRIIALKDGAAAAREDEARKSKLRNAKNWPKIDLTQFDVTATLSTSWQDGKLFYVVRFDASEPAGAQTSDKTVIDDSVIQEQRVAVAERTMASTKLLNTRFTLLLEDLPFELAKADLEFIRRVNKAGKAVALDAKGDIPMADKTYEKLDGWNVIWRSPTLPR